MDGPLTVVTGTVGLSWPERREAHGAHDAPDARDLTTREDSPTVLSTRQRWTNGVPTAQMSTAPLSPISTELDMSCVDGVSSAIIPPRLPLTNPAGSTWSTNYQDDESGEDVERDVNWEHDAGDGPTVPKIEPVEDDSFRMEDVQEVPRESEPRSHTRPPSSQTKIKRPRGRPRKHPLAPQEVSNKVAKGRSKTGCITCRKRKKKCDEAKPRCETTLRYPWSLPN